MALHKSFDRLRTDKEASILETEKKWAKVIEDVLADLAPHLHQHLADTVGEGMTAEDFKHGGRIVKESTTHGPGWIVSGSKRLSGVVFYIVSGFQYVEVSKIFEVSRKISAVKQGSLFDQLGEDGAEPDWTIRPHRIDSWVIRRLPRQDDGNTFGDAERATLGEALVEARAIEAEAANRERNRMSRPGQILRSIRTLAALTQDQVAAEIGVSGDQISRYELGKISPSIKYLLTLADMTGVPFLGIVAMLARSLGNEYAPDPERNPAPYQAYKELLAWAGENMPQDQ